MFFWLIFLSEYGTFNLIEALSHLPLKGKYYIETSDNKSLLLRIADISEYENKKAEFEHIKQKLKATSQNPSDRYPNIKTFMEEWERANI